MLENNEQVPVSSEPVTREGEDAGAVEKLVPVSEAIRYRRRAQAAEKELGELKESFEKQEQELKKVKGEQVKGNSEEALRANFDTPSPLRGTPPLQGESPLPQAAPAVKTQGVKEARTMGTHSILQHAAKQAAGSGSRADVQEYLRLRRAYV